MKLLSKSLKTLALSALVVVGAPLAVFAANNTTLNQTISAGVLSTDILDGSLNAVASPAVAMTAKTTSFNCQNGANASTGTLGSTAQRLYVNNPSGADSGWTLTLAASDGPNAQWSNAGATNQFDFNDSSASGCNDGADTDAKAGQLTVNPAGALTTDCQSCTNTGISTGSQAGFTQGSTDSVTLLNAASSSDDVWRGYLTGVGLSQSVPAETPTDSYSLNLTLTATAQ